MVGLAVLLTSAVVKIAADKLSSTIGGQANLVWNFSKNMEEMKETLESMAAVLKDAERRSVREESVCLWLKRLKHAALDISDMLDEFEATESQVTAKIPGMLACLPTACKNIILTNKMKNMREKLRRIDEQHKTFNFTLNTGGSINQQHYDQRETTSDVNEEEITGRNWEKQAILDLLSARSENKDETMILPIYGLGGIGKSTIAGLVYNDTQFNKYDHRVWIYVSQEFDLKKIGSSIISQLPREASQQNTDTMQLINKCLDDLFHGKKILIVLDDLWEETDFELEKLKRMLQVGRKGSAIDVIVTTRREDIANKICTHEPYMLHPLKDDYCWDIIKKFSQCEHKANKAQFEQIGLDIAHKCGGVALAAKALGYLLRSKDIHRWSEVNNSDIWNESSMGENLPHNTVLPSLKLSYEGMPPHLRLCFAYCAVFTEGHDIVKDDLIHQWIALDFIEPSMSLGEECINQLLGMSFLQLSKLPLASRKHVVRYTMHGLVRDLARSAMCDELIVFDVVEKNNRSEQKYCRYALLKNYSQTTKISHTLSSKVRALHLLDRNLVLRDGEFSFAKTLRILDFSNCSSVVFPSSVGQMKQLRYLNAPRMQNECTPDCITKLSKLQYLNLQGSSKISELPESISNLGCLIYLDLSSCSDILELPKSFGHLKHLLHLDLSGCSSLLKLSESFGNLKNLLHLNLSSCAEIKELPDSLGDLTNLLHLELSGCHGIKALPEALCGVNKLQYLNISSCSNIGGLPNAFGNLAELQYFNLSSCIGIAELPESICNLRNLVHLDLSGCTNVKGIPRALGGLTALQHLNISNLSKGTCGLADYLHLEGLPDVLGSLADLKYLNLSNTLNPWSTKERLIYVDTVDCITALINLHHLDLSWNWRLESLPESLGNLKRLNTLDLSYCFFLKSLPESIGAIPLKSVLVEGCSDELINHIGHSQFSNSPSTLPLFTVSADDFSGCSNIHLLKGINSSELNLRFLQNVRSLEEAGSVQLLNKHSLSKLTLSWAWDSDRHLEDKDLLSELMPPRGLRCLELSGYTSISLPTWLMGISRYLPNLVSISLVDMPGCNNLPPLGQLPNLQDLCIKLLSSINKIDGDFCGGNRAFGRLSRFELAEMEGLEEWYTTYCSEDGREEFMFPVLDRLSIMHCRKLILKPRLPVCRHWKIEATDMVISSWGPREEQSSHSSSTPIILLQVSCSVPSDKWGLLQHLPNLQALEIRFCHYLKNLPGSIRYLTSLRFLEISECYDISELLESLSDLASLEILTIDFCRSMTSLPCIQQLTKLQKLHIKRNGPLKQWCELEENKKNLSHIKDIVYEDCDW